MDMFFIIDTSRGVTRDELNRMKEFVLKQADVYKLSDRDAAAARFSVIAYADRATMQLPLNRGTSVGALRNALLSVGLSGADRRVESGLELAKDTIAKKRDGVKDDRGKVVVLMVGGRSDASGLDSIVSEGDGLRRAGAKTVIIGVGSQLDESALKSGARNEESFVRVKSADELLDATPTISSAVKDAGKTSVAVDMVFILGATGSNAEKDFNLAKQAVIEMLKKLDLSKDKARVGVILYGQRASIALRFDSLKDGESPLSVVELIRAPRERGFALSEALNFARNFVFSERYGGRRDVPKTAVVFVNRDIDEASRLAADGLRKDGVKIIAVSLGEKDSRDSLKRITSSDDDIGRITKPGDIDEALAKRRGSSLVAGRCSCGCKWMNMMFSDGLRV